MWVSGYLGKNTMENRGIVHSELWLCPGSKIKGDFVRFQRQLSSSKCETLTPYDPTKVFPRLPGTILTKDM